MDDLTSTISSLLTWNHISTVGDILSIASFVLTVFVLVETRKLRSIYILRMRGPSLIRELSKSASNLSNYVLEFEDSVPQIAEELGRIGVKLKCLKEN